MNVGLYMTGSWKLGKKMVMTAGKDNCLRGGTSYSIQLFYF